MIRTDLIASIPELLNRHAAARGEKIAFEDAAEKITYGALLKSTANLAGHLADFDLEVGDRVALFLPNSVRWVEACFAILRAGGVCVPISYDSTEAEVEYRLQDAQCKIVVSTVEKTNLIASVKKSSPDLKNVILTGDIGNLEDVISYDRLGENLTKTQPRDPEDIDCVSYIVYTSGTTGQAKGVRLTTRGMLWITAACWAPIAGMTEDDVVLSPLPLFHSYALNLSVLAILALGASEYIMEKFSTDEVLALAREGRFTIIPGVPTMFHYLLEQSGEKSGPGLAGIRMCISAGAIMPAALNEQFESKFGIPLLDGYGITETSTMVTMNWPTGGRIMGSCGLPLPGLAVRLLDPDTGLDVETGKEGELIVAGPNVMLGYHDKEAETAAALKNGWYYTGDLAVSDRHGFLTITGRLKELIIRGGQNIAPAEIEEIVKECESVLDCAIVGMPHEHLGEVPAAFVVVREGFEIGREAILGHCKSRLSKYKIPADIYEIEEIPRTGSGKIKRFLLKELAD